MLPNSGVIFAFQIDMFVIHRVSIRPIYESIYAVIIGFVIRPIRIGKQSFWIFRVSAIGIRLTIIRVHAYTLLWFVDTHAFMSLAVAVAIGTRVSFITYSCTIPIHQIDFSRLTGWSAGGLQGWVIGISE